MKGTLDGGGARVYHYRPMCRERSRVRENRESGEGGGPRAHQRQRQATACAFVIPIRVAELQLFPADAPQHASQLLLQHQFSVRTAHLSRLSSPVLPPTQLREAVTVTGLGHAHSGSGGLVSRQGTGRPQTSDHLPASAVQMLGL